VYRQGSFIFTLVLTLLVLAFALGALRYIPAARQIPLVVAVPTLLLLIFLLVAELVPNLSARGGGGFTNVLETQLQGRPGGARTGVSDTTDRPEWRASLPVMGWMASFVALTMLLGFRISVPVFLVAYLRVRGKIGLLRAVLIGLAVSAGLYVALNSARITIWQGAIPEIIPDILGGANPPPL